MRFADFLSTKIENWFLTNSCQFSNSKGFVELCPDELVEDFMAGFVEDDELLKMVLEGLECEIELHNDRLLTDASDRAESRRIDRQLL